MVADMSIKALIENGQFCGVAPGVSNALYHRSPGLSSSGLVLLSEAPALYRYNKDHPNDETDSQRLGTLTHAAVLEPWAFEKNVIAIEGHRGKKEVKEQIRAAQINGKYVCKPQEYDLALAMASAIEKHSWARKILTTGQTEVSLFAKDPQTGVLVKCRPDALHEDKGLIADLKTAGSLSDRELDKHMKRMKYDWKAAFYLDVTTWTMGKEFTRFAHVFVSTAPPHLVRVLALSAPTMEKARELYRPHLQRYANCLTENNWPGFPDDIEDFDLYYDIW